MKNSLLDLNNHLFAQLERLGDEDLSVEQLDIELQRAKAMTDVSKEIISNSRLVLDAKKVQLDYNQKDTPLLLGQDK